MAIDGGGTHSAGMVKQILLVAVWGYAGWYLGAMIAFQLGLPAIVGPADGRGRRRVHRPELSLERARSGSATR